MTENNANNHAAGAGNDKQPQSGGVRSVFRSGLRRTLLLWFLALSLIPVTAVGVIGYLNGHVHLMENAEESLKLVCMEHARDIQAYFSNMWMDLRRKSAKRVNYEFLEDLIKGFKESHQPLREYVKSFKWATTVSRYGTDLGIYRRDYGYHDILFLDAQGNILFTVAGEKDLGTNIFSGKSSDTLFASACKRALKTGRPSFSDFEFYGPSGNAGAGFLVSAMVNDDGDKIGLMVFQLSIDPINRMMTEGLNSGETLEIYLIGGDLKVRSHSMYSKGARILGKPVETEITSLWLKEHSEDGKSAGEADEKEEAVLIYQGPNGKSVLGVHDNITIAGTSFVIIAEIEETEAFAPANQLRNMVIILLAGMTLLVFFAATMVSNRIVRPIHRLSELVKRAAGGKFDQEIEAEARNEIGELAGDANRMLHGLREMTEENQRKDWFETGQGKLNDKMRGDQEPTALGRGIITFLAEYLNARIAAFYIADDHHRLKLLGSYAFSRRKNLSNEFEFGEGLVGQAALEKESITITNVPDDYIAVSSSLGETPPRNILVFPVLLNDEVKGVIELGTFDDFQERDLDFLNQVSEGIAIAVESARSRGRVQGLLERTQAQSEELEVQQEELRQNNDELEEQAEALKTSEGRLKEQREELRQTNEELEEQSGALEEKTEALEAQKGDIEKKNAQLEEARKTVEEKARDLEMSGRYKSEFLANMSHELRTPLNSILLLSGFLSENKDGRLEDDQVESSRAIHSSGTELLTLINEVLDLSKVESGKMELVIEEVGLEAFSHAMKREFQPLADEKEIELLLDLADNLPETIRTDRQRLNQIIKNFFSNAFKFTATGSVTLRVSRPGPGDDATSMCVKTGLDPEKSVCLSVVDTGSGIEEGKQKQIFEAFHQADGSISRKYGGTGLGLSISRELARLLGGRIGLESESGKGSAFTLYLPLDLASEKPKSEAVPDVQEAETGPQSEKTDQQKAVADVEALDDDRNDISPDDRSILIIEDDPVFLKVLRDLARGAGFKCLVAGDGETGLQFADFHKPSAIILDIGLPSIDGWTVMSRLKENSQTRHIPVHIISGKSENRDAFKMGAVDFLTKPVSQAALGNVFAGIDRMISKRVKDLLVVEDNDIQRDLIADIIGNGDVRITFALTAAEGYDQALTGKFDCMVLDLGLPDMSGVELLDKIRTSESSNRTPVIIFTGRELTPEEKVTMDKYAESTILKGADSVKRLLDETTLFLHRVEADLPERQRKMLRMVHDKESILAGKKVLMVDDDMRNVFSLKKILEERGIHIVVGKNGRDGIDRLNENPDVDLVLMDIMMPEMNGFEAMEEIRKERRFRDLPIIALTAKAMKGDRAKCIEAGANDYLAKPVDVDRLFSMLRVWLY